MNRNLAARTRRLALAAALATLAFGAVAPQGRAVAADAAVPTVTVPFADLNLAHQAGSEKLYRRIENAAERVCGSPSGLDLKQRITARLCIEQAMARAIAGVSHPGFVAWHAARTGRAVPPPRVADRQR